MAGISIPIILVLVLAAPPIFGFVFGSDWREAGVYVQILTPMFMLRFIAGGLNSSTMISGRQGFDLLIQLGLIIAVSTAFIASLLFNLPVDLMFAFLNMTCSAVYIASIVFFWRCAKCPRK